MIAPQRFEREARIRNPRIVRAATQARKGRASRARYATVLRVFSGLICVLAVLMFYVVLTSNLTGLSYAVSQAAAQREALQEATIRLDDRIAALRSDERLAVLAARLGMREPHQFAMIRLEEPRLAAAPKHLPILSSLAGFLVPAIAARP